MQELLQFLAKNLVDDPEAVQITERDGDDGTVLELHVAPEDMGKVIGKQGRMIRQIRTLVGAFARRQGKNVSVSVVD